VLMRILRGGGPLRENFLRSRPPPVMIRFTIITALPRKGGGKTFGSTTRGDRPRCDVRFFTCQTAVFVPAARLRPGDELESPPPRGGRSADRRTDAALRIRSARHNAADQALARRLASRNAGRSPLGAPPWRFLGSGSALPSAALPPQRVQRGSSRRRSYCLAGGCPCLPGLRLRAAAAGRHALLRLWTVSGRRPSMSKAKRI
jgi:hypothetical protein